MNDQPTINPYASPESPKDPAVESRIQSLKWLRGAALGLIVLAGLQLILCVTGIFGVSFALLAAAQGFLVPEDPFWMLLLQLIGCIAAIARAIPLLYGAIQMRNGRRYRWAMAAAILGLGGLFHPLLWFDVPFGIWAVILLRKAKYKQLFET